MTREQKRFPQAVALTAFVLYALTLSRGVTLHSLDLTAKVAGWDWLPMSSRPLTWLVTLPLHLLPEGWIPFALNLVSAALAAMTLGLLARCVELLPWDCLPDAKRPWIARLPALLAVAVCGFEFSFWQEATAMTGEMMDVFLLAAAIWCLLEYRVRNEMRWLNLAALVWGVGMTENWVMLATLPLFVAALIALQGLRFFEKNFLVRMALLGLAGFSQYALLPLVNWLNPHSPWGFVESWRASLRVTKGIIHALRYDFWSWHRLPTIAVLMYFLVPALPCFVRMKNEAAANLPDIDRYQVWFYRALRVALLLACAWLVFDPEVGPRGIIRQQLSRTLPLLTFDFVNALGIAFIAGSLLYAAQLLPEFRPPTLLENFISLLQRCTTALLVGGALVVIASLLARNLPAILLANRQSLTVFGDSVIHMLPTGGGIVFGDDSRKLAVLQAALAQHAENRRWQVVELKFIPDPKYRAALERQSPAGWTAIGNGRALTPNETLQLVDDLSRSNRIFFLQPHNGDPLFERFQPLPLGAVHELKRYENNRLSSTPLMPRRMAEVEQFWDDAWRGRLASLSQVGTQPSRLDKLLKKRLELVPVRRDQSRQLGQWYSAAFNDWGVTLLLDGQTSAAQQRFEQALDLNTNNMVAAVNLFCCTNLPANKQLEPFWAQQVAEKFRDLPQFEQLIHECGDFADPGIRCGLGNFWLTAGWPRQAWLEFDGARKLAPDAIEPQLALAGIYSRYRFDAEVFEIVRHLRPLVTNSPAGEALELQLSLFEAKSWMSQTNPAQANKILDALLQTHPNVPMYKEAVFNAYVAMGEATKALGLVEAELAKAPDNFGALNDKAAILIQINQPAEAIPLLDHALSLTNLPAIRLNRANAYLQVKNMAAAENDLALLEDAPVDQSSVHFGLAQTALYRGDTNAATTHFEFCLSNTPPQSPAWREARGRLDALGR
ncbi:MAG: DUF2723 domain-containing protein [Verrucomicrobia bacterium]|nr:DUF2723 domain-containing protein [Verrucomicrobiota bacterium]